MDVFVLIYIFLCLYYWNFAGSKEIPDEEIAGFARWSYLFLLFSFFFGISGFLSKEDLIYLPYLLGVPFWVIIYKINLDEVRRRVDEYSKIDKDKKTGVYNGTEEETKKEE